jgi:hypothetical protein
MPNSSSDSDYSIRSRGRKPTAVRPMSRVTHVIKARVVERSAARRPRFMDTSSDSDSDIISLSRKRPGLTGNKRPFICLPRSKTSVYMKKKKMDVWGDSSSDDNYTATVAGGTRPSTPTGANTPNSSGTNSSSGTRSNSPVGTAPSTPQHSAPITSTATAPSTPKRIKIQASSKIRTARSASPPNVRAKAQPTAAAAAPKTPVPHTTVAPGGHHSPMISPLAVLPHYVPKVSKTSSATNPLAAQPLSTPIKEPSKSSGSSSLDFETPEGGISNAPARPTRTHTGFFTAAEKAKAAAAPAAQPALPLAALPAAEEIKPVHVSQADASSLAPSEGHKNVYTAEEKVMLDTIQYLGETVFYPIQLLPLPDLSGSKLSVIQLMRSPQGLSAKAGYNTKLDELMAEENIPSNTDVYAEGRLNASRVFSKGYYDRYLAERTRVDSENKVKVADVAHTSSTVHAPTSAALVDVSQSVAPNDQVESAEPAEIQSSINDDKDAYMRKFTEYARSFTLKVENFDGVNVQNIALLSRYFNSAKAGAANTAENRIATLQAMSRRLDLMLPSDVPEMRIHDDGSMQASSKYIGVKLSIQERINDVVARIRGVSEADQLEKEIDERAKGMEDFMRSNQEESDRQKRIEAEKDQSNLDAAFARRLQEQTDLDAAAAQRAQYDADQREYEKSVAAKSSVVEAKVYVSDDFMGKDLKLVERMNNTIVESKVDNTLENVIVSLRGLQAALLDLRNKKWQAEIDENVRQVDKARAAKKGSRPLLPDGHDTEEYKDDIQVPGAFINKKGLIDVQPRKKFSYKTMRDFIETKIEELMNSA